jgi:deazaflavin-dependent oxidoreductase (nitroreductase family)
MMASRRFETALDSANEIDLTTTGRKTGRESSRPVWFVRQGETLYLVPATGTDSQWYKNVLVTSAVRLTAEGAYLATEAAPVKDAHKVAQVVDAFRAKYGAQDVGRYYSNPNAAVEICLIGEQVSGDRN